jgi:hypothetical protein
LRAVQGLRSSSLRGENQRNLRNSLKVSGCEPPEDV